MTGPSFQLPPSLSCLVLLPVLLMLIIFTGHVVLAKIDCHHIEKGGLTCVANVSYGTDSEASLAQICKKWQQVPVCLELVISECQEMIDPSEVHLLKNLTLHWHQRFDKHCQTIRDLQTSGTMSMTSSSSSAPWRPLLLKGLGAVLIGLKAIRRR